jgi:hypothetical protein
MALNTRIKSDLVKYSVYSINYLYANLLYTNIVVLYSLWSFQRCISYIVEINFLGEGPSDPHAE